MKFKKNERIDIILLSCYIENTENYIIERREEDGSYSKR